MSYRNKEEAIKCKHLRQSNNGKYLDGPLTLGFVCLNPNVKGEYPVAQFSSLDICCFCKHYEEGNMGK